MLTSEYSPTGATFACALLLCVGLACWVPFVLDGCQHLTLRCDHCDKTVLELDPHCLCF